MKRNIFDHFFLDIIKIFSKIGNFNQHGIIYNVENVENQKRDDFSEKINASPKRMRMR